MLSQRVFCSFWQPWEESRRNPVKSDALAKVTWVAWWANSTQEGNFQLSTVLVSISKCPGKSSCALQKASISYSVWEHFQLSDLKWSVCCVSYTGLVWPIKVSIWTHCSIPLVLCKGLLKRLIVYVNKMTVVSVRTEMSIYLCCWWTVTRCHKKTQGSKEHTFLFLVKDRVLLDLLQILSFSH